MRIALALALALAGLVGLCGCQNNKGPQTTEPEMSAEPMTFTPADVPPPEPMPTPIPQASRAPAYTYAPAPATPTPVPMAPPASAGRTHTVQPGETLWKISGLYFGRSSRDNVQKIVQANPGLNPDRILAGQKITIPD